MPGWLVFLLVFAAYLIADALGAACDRSTNLNVPILQRRVSARFGCGEEVRRAWIEAVSCQPQLSAVGVGIGIGVEKTVSIANRDTDSDSDTDAER